jgi:hypothetical protein
MRAVVFFSGGAVSWAAAKRTVERYGADATTLLFTDTLIEDADLYRFIREAAANVGAELVWIKEGRTPWEVFRDTKMLGNTRADPCSRVLKREPAERWLKEHCHPTGTVLVFGIDWTEGHRFDDGAGHGVRPRYAKLGWPHVEAPMIDAPYLGRREVFEWMRSEGLRPPRLYDLGFAHNNCGGGCVKAGKGHFAHLLRALPDVYAEWEANEQAFNDARPGKRRQTILRDEFADKPTQPLSLRELRERIQAGGQVDLFEIGGCGCFLDDAA